MSDLALEEEGEVAVARLLRQPTQIGALLPPLTRLVGADRRRDRHQSEQDRGDDLERARGCGRLAASRGCHQYAVAIITSDARYAAAPSTRVANRAERSLLMPATPSRNSASASMRAA